MMKFITINRTGIIAFFAAMILAFVFSAAAHAQGDDLAKKYNITFPVAELGNCASLDECKTYCAVPANQTACTNFAKSHGFYKAPPTQSEILAAAQSELGCSTQDECKAFCGLQENWIKCG